MVKVNLRPGEGLREARSREAMELKDALSHVGDGGDSGNYVTPCSFIASCGLGFLSDQLGVQLIMEVCWSETRTGETVTACSENQLRGCQCPQGFCGDGHKCEGLIYECKCKGDHLYIKEQDVCIGGTSRDFVAYSYDQYKMKWIKIRMVPCFLVLAA
ncbi:hypothetical protein SLEP1_g34149 [Rubroshorea leprosula]|uniref:EGF-like domain-containing protein n=1 Tax=Rubroshorea leprosula TaxID=152421 RepID=A0AAV5KIY1_9ROSI|nr:hypothetical protein SLEP1_g34149 [Rubroshorea leprosula]